MGKSALFNRLVGQRRTIVEDFPGVTRDRVYADIEVGGRVVTLVDTGGLVGAENDLLIGQVKEQAARALGEADLLLALFDGQEGLVAFDYDVAEAARKSGKPVVAVVNKMESSKGEAAPFAELGFGVPVAISALHSQGIGKLEAALAAALPEVEEGDTGGAPVPPGTISIAIVGRPNVGKSALTNSLLGDERMIVSELPGTTRDTVDTLLQAGGQSYQLVDTPGLRRRGKRAQGVEYYSSIRSIKALQRAEVGVVVFDAEEGMTQQDAAIALEVDSAHRPLIVVANKWDLVRDRAFATVEPTPTDPFPPAPLGAKEQQKAERLIRKDFETIIRGKLKFAAQAPVALTCALTGEGVGEILPLAAKISEQYRRRVDTGVLNRALAEAMDKHNPPTRGGKALRIYYATQAQAAPPTFVLFVNDPKLMHFSYERFLTNFLRAKFGLSMVPLTIRVRQSSKRQERIEKG